MLRDCDAIRFESRQELLSLLVVLKRCLDEHPSAPGNDHLVKLYRLLDDMEFNW